MAISKGNLAHDHGENVTSKRVRRSLVSTPESGENVMQNRTQNGAFILPKTIGIHFSFIAKITGDTLLTKMSAELPSTEQDIYRN